MKTKILIHKHRMEGGTGVTNFSPKCVKLYEDAIFASGEENLVVSDMAIKNEAGATNLFSLHCLDKEKLNLSHFWTIVNNLKKNPAYNY